MKKLLILMLVLGLTSIASATIVGLHIEPTAPGGSRATELSPSGNATVYVTVDTTGIAGNVLNLGVLDVIISIDGGGATGTILTALKLADLPAGAVTWGAQVNYWGGPPPAPPLAWVGGWQAALSFNPILPAGGQSAEIGVGQNGNQVYATSLPPMTALPADAGHPGRWWYEGAVGYVDIHCLGTGDITVSIANGFGFGPSGTTMDDGVTVPAFGGSVTVYQIPEPMTIVLLGLGGLLLRRRK